MLIACVPPQQQQTTPTDGLAYKSDLTALKADLRAEIDKKADKSTVDALTKIIGTGSQPVDTYTKAEIDAKIKAAIDALKADQSWIRQSSTSSGSGNTSPASGTVTWFTNPTNVQVLGNAQVCFTLKVQNTTGQWVYARPIININAQTGQSPTKVNAVTLTIGGSAINLSTSNFQFTPVLPTSTPTSTVIAIPVSGGNGSGEMQLGANASVDLLVCIQIDAENPIIWNIGISFNWRSL